MPNNQSIADFEVKWSRMVTNVARNAAVLPEHISIYNAPMEELLNQFREIGASKEDRKAAKQQQVKDSQEMLRTGRRLAGKLRSALIAHYGPDSEELLAYGINPRRPRKSKPGTPAPSPETQPVPQSGGQVTQGQAAAQAAEQPKPEGPAPAPQSDPAPQAT
jgi:hypothetical protein